MRLRKYLKEGLSAIPTEKNKYTSDSEIIRAAIVAEYDATNLYIQMAELAKSKEVKTILLDIAREEKVHIGEFEQLLRKLDKEHIEAEEEGKEEVNDINIH